MIKYTHTYNILSTSQIILNGQTNILNDPISLLILKYCDLIIYYGIAQLNEFIGRWSNKNKYRIDYLYQIVFERAYYVVTNHYNIYLYILFLA